MSFYSIYGNAVRAMLCKGRKKESNILCEKLFLMRRNKYQAQAPEGTTDMKQ